ncbi:MAG: hypothetical protein WC440_07090 [Candidatus Omnitrophota bacterium]|jgi:hypothetical protein
MPKVRFEDGTVIKFDGEPTPEDIEEAYNQVKGVEQPKQGGGAGGSFAPDNLPGFKKTEAKIAQRPDAGETFADELAYDPYRNPELNLLQKTGQAVLKPAVTAAKGIGAIAQRAEGAIANPLMDLQEGKVNPIELGKSVIKGATGERKGELGDVLRRVDVAEPIAAAGGLFASMGIANAATTGKLASSARKGEAFVKSKVPQVMNKDYVINRAKIAGQGMDELYGGLSDEYEQVFSKIGKNQVDPAKVNTVLENLAAQGQENIVNRIAKQLGSNPTSNVNTVQAMKQVLRKSVPDKVWNGKAIADSGQHFLKEAYHDLNSIVAEGNDELLSLNKRYRDFLQMRDTLARVIYDDLGNVKSKGLESVFKPGAERSKQQFFEKFAEQWPQAQQIIKDMVKFNKRQTAKKILWRAAPWVGGSLIGAGTVGGVMGARKRE